MQNDQGQPVDLYIPRKCSWTNRLIGASDQASVQINVGTIDPNTGLHTGGSETYALSGYVRNKGESDMALTELDPARIYGVHRDGAVRSDDGGRTFDAGQYTTREDCERGMCAWDEHK